MGEWGSGVPDELRAKAVEQSLVDVAVESWRLARLFTRLISKLDAGEGTRYSSQLRYFHKKLAEALEVCGLALVDLEGQIFDPGMAATALNLGDFGPDDTLVVDQMMEPVVVGPQGLLRTGTMMLRRSAE